MGRALFIITLFFGLMHCQPPASTAVADEVALHPIHRQLQHCHSLDSNQTTQGMMRCEAIARDQWMEEVQKSYDQLTAILDESETRALREAQQNWFRYRDEEMRFSGEMYYNLEGTLWRIAAVSRQRELVEVRARELQSYLDAKLGAED